MASLSNDPAARSLFEVALGFLGALLILPLLFRAIGGLFRLGVVRRLIGEALFVGLTALLTREDVLDKLFGRKGETGGLLKSNPND